MSKPLVATGSALALAEKERAVISACTKAALAAAKARGQVLGNPRLTAGAPPPAPKPPAKIEGYDKMTFAQRWVAGEQRRQGGPK
jgi:DNA invertase Pin-like site-specific DNA recombinase